MLGHLDLTLSEITLENQHGHCSTLPTARQGSMEEAAADLHWYHWTWGEINQTYHRNTVVMSSLVGDAGC
jgi:hypothetical protein